MSYTPIQPFPLDAFGKLQVSSPQTIFDSKQITSNQSFYWDEQEVSGSGTSSVHSTDRASTRMSVSATTVGKRVRQTFQRFNYQPGKSQRILITGVLGAGASGIIRELGLFDDNNGLFFRLSGTTFSVVRRSFVTGVAVDTVVNQSSWNVDPMDGTGPSGVTVDTSKALIFDISFEWLGVGKTFIGFIIDGKRYVAHEFKNSNVLTSVYMSTPNLPVRYSIENDGTGASSSIEAICSSVQSEGGQENNGVLFYTSTGGTHLDANTANSIYAVIGFKYQTGKEGTTIEFEGMSMINQTNDDFEWLVIVNPTSVAGTFTYSNYSGSSLQVAIASGAAGTIVTGGSIGAGGFTTATSGGEISADLKNAVRMGSSISGTSDEYLLCVRPLSANADIEAGVIWRELS